MTTDQFGGLVRTLAAVVIPLLAAHGLGNDVATWLVGGVDALLIGSWSFWTNRPAKVLPSALVAK